MAARIELSGGLIAKVVRRLPVIVYIEAGHADGNPTERNAENIIFICG